MTEEGNIQWRGTSPPRDHKKLLSGEDVTSESEDVTRKFVDEKVCIRYGRLDCLNK